MHPASLLKCQFQFGPPPLLRRQHTFSRHLSASSGANSPNGRGGNAGSVTVRATTRSLSIQLSTRGGYGAGQPDRAGPLRCVASLHKKEGRRSQIAENSNNDMCVSRRVCPCPSQPVTIASTPAGSPWLGACLPHPVPPHSASSCPFSLRSRARAGVCACPNPLQARAAPAALAGAHARETLPAFSVTK